MIDFLRALAAMTWIQGFELIFLLILPLVGVAISAFIIWYFKDKVPTSFADWDGNQNVDQWIKKSKKWRK